MFGRQAGRVVECFSYFGFLLVWFIFGCGRPAGDLVVSAEEDAATSVSRFDDGIDRLSHIGSTGCRDCHTRFHELWATSHHGLAMQPFTERLAKENLEALDNGIRIGENDYLVEIEAGEARMLERGPGGEKAYKIKYALGGKNVYYFLTSAERGRLQVLPVAYDVQCKEWYDTTASAVRHFVGRPDQALSWRDRELTFNTSCYNCHVSQLSTNYDPKTDSYRTVWSEPGINCETCHGSAVEHIRVCRQAQEEGATPADLKLRVVTQERGFSSEQVNASCAPCHSKMVPLSKNFQPGDCYFDHFDLVCLEHPDFYPDGRDLGENYTYTSWLMSPCVKAGQLDCLHCHTSSGRYRHKDNPNKSCLPCHKDRVENVASHSHHPADSLGSRCITCHMPMTEFARMRRSDHSMLPPTPAVTCSFKSPNACNICHNDQDAVWADEFVRKWHEDDYQSSVIHRATLVDAARRRDWSWLGDMLDYIKNEDSDEVTTTSLIRLMERYPRTGSEIEKVRRVMISSLRNDPSPLVRAAVVVAMSNNLDRPYIEALLPSLRDESRLVRIRAASSLAVVPVELLPRNVRRDLDRAIGEFENAMRVRPDDAASHHDLGNYHMGRRQFSKAVEAFERSIFLDPRNIQPMVNVSMAYGALGEKNEAEVILRRALDIQPGSAAVNFNLGLLLGELGRNDEAEESLRRAVKADDKLPAAAFNLGVILADKRLDESIRWCERAVNLAPENAEYAYTLAFYRNRKGDERGAVEALIAAIKRRAVSAEVYGLLGLIYQRNKEMAKAVQTYRCAAADAKLAPIERRHFGAMALRLESD